MPAHHSLAFRLRTVLLCLLLSLCGFLPAWAEPPVIDLNALPAGPLGQYAQWLQEEGSAPLTLAEARIAFAAGKAIDSQRPVLSFGIGAAPRWLRVRMHNPTSAPQPGQDSSSARRGLTTSTFMLSKTTNCSFPGVTVTPTRARRGCCRESVSVIH